MQNRSVSHLAKWAQITSLLGIFILSTTIIFWLYLLIFQTSAFDLLMQQAVIGDVPVTLTQVIRGIAFVFLVFPLLLCIYLLYNSFNLFQRYKQGDVLTVKSCKTLSKIGWITVLLAPIYTFNETMFSLVVTMFNKPNQRILAVQVDETDILAILIGLLLVIVSHIMRHAVSIAEENKSFI